MMRFQERLWRGAPFLVLAPVLAAALAACGGSGGSSAPPVYTPPPASPAPDPVPEPAEPETPPVPDPAPAGDDFHPGDRGWDLVWSDEFDGDALDPDKWAPEESCWGGGNDERQCYTAREDNIDIVNGLLRLILLEEEYTGPLYPPEWNDPAPTGTQAYTSGKIRTRGLADWRYGRISARMKLPRGQGTWPAFWMMPAEDHYGGWPKSGEIDIMEAVNLTASCTDCSGETGENHISVALHFGGEPPANSSLSSRGELADGGNPADGYHVYALEWGEGLIHWFMDDRLIFTAENYQWYTEAENAEGNEDAPFDRSFYLMLNLAFGGRYPEPLNDLGVDEDAPPEQLLVDWVRIYQCTEDLETGRACIVD